MSPAERGRGSKGGGPKKSGGSRKTPARKTSARRPKQAPSFVEPTVGSTIASYRIEEVIGRGGMGVLFRAEDQRSATRGRHVALKVLSPSLAGDDRFRRRFERESQMAASLDHPNIVPVFEAGEDAGVLYIAMRYVEGQDLHAFLQGRGPLEPDLAVGIVAQVAAALDASHAQGLVHRDVKPANILVVGGDAAAPHVYLTDFGVTKRTESRSGLTATGQFVGTVEYVAPEQIEGRQVDHRADIYSLGCVLFECLTGSAPFAREQDAATLWAHLSEPPPPPTSRRPELPPAIDAVIERALAKSPDDRYGTCRELVEAARGALREGRRRAAPPPAPTSPAGPVPDPSPARMPVPSPPPPVTAPRYASSPGITPPAGYPQTAPRTGLSTPWIVTLAGGAVALVILIAIVLSLGGGNGGDTPGGDTPGGGFPNPAEQQLLGRIPASLQTPACTRATEAVPGATGAVDCFTDTPQLLTYAQFSDAGSMNAAYQERVAQAGVASETGDCSQGQPSEDSWVDAAGAQNGRLLCFTNEVGAPAVVWTHDEHLILGEASRPAGDPVALYEFWTGIADYSATAPTPGA